MKSASTRRSARSPKLCSRPAQSAVSMKAPSPARKRKRRPTPRRSRQPSAPPESSPPPDSAPYAQPFSRQEEAQFALLVAEHLPQAMSFVKRFWWVSDPESAVWEALRKTLLGFDPAKGRFSTLLRRILLHELIDMMRADARWRRLSSPLPQDFEPVDKAAELQMLRLLLRDWLGTAVKELSRPEQELFRLKYEQDLSIEEIITCL